MADDKSKFSMSTVTTKQKVVGIATVVIVIFLIYEVVGMFSGGSSAPAETSAAAAIPAKSMSAANPSAQTPGGAATMPTGMHPAQPAAVPNTSQITTASVAPAPAPKDTETMKAQDEQQKAYLESLNQLQLLKLKRDIAETNQAIATARLATETANKNMSDLLTTPAVPVAPASSFINNLGGAPPNTPPPVMGETDQIKPPPPVEIPFAVISVSMQFQHWTAVLGAQGKLYSVSIGDTLEDGSTVASINRTGVVIVKDGKRRKLGILSTI